MTNGVSCISDTEMLLFSFRLKQLLQSFGNWADAGFPLFQISIIADSPVMYCLSQTASNKIKIEVH